MKRHILNAMLALALGGVMILSGFFGARPKEVTVTVDGRYVVLIAGNQPRGRS